MRNLFFIPLLLIVPVIAHADMIIYNDCLQGNGEAKTVTRDLSGFEVVDSSGVFDINIKSSAKGFKVQVTADENLIKHISTTLQGNRLMIFPDRSICPEVGVRVEIEMPTLEAIVSSGSDNITATGINSYSLHLLLDGSGDARLSGKAATLDANINGSGTIDASHLTTKKSVINISGSGDATVNASEELKVDISGVGDVNYYGHPKIITRQISGVGDLNQMD